MSFCAKINLSHLIALGYQKRGMSPISGNCAQKWGTQHFPLVSKMHQEYLKTLGFCRVGALGPQNAFLGPKIRKLWFSRKTASFFAKCWNFWISCNFWSPSPFWSPHPLPGRGAGGGWPEKGRGGGGKGGSGAGHDAAAPLLSPQGDYLVFKLFGRPGLQIPCILNSFGRPELHIQLTFESL